jgi:hypothetical protein
MKTFLISFLLLCSCVQLSAQNLIPNPSFEEYDLCPMEFGDFNGFVRDWTNTSISGLAGTPDYFNACNVMDCSVGVPFNRQADFAPALDGEAYAGFFTYYTGSPNPEAREYITVQLEEPLLEGFVYQISLFVQRAEGSFYATPFGIHLSNDFLEQEEDLLIDVDPNVAESPLVSDTTWQEITNFYTASGGEQYLTIGNFRSNIEMNLQDPGNFPTECSSLFTTGAAYYFIDGMYIGEPLSTGFIESKTPRITVFPNPCIRNFTVELEEDMLPATLHITDKSGRLLYHVKLNRKRTAIQTDQRDGDVVLLQLEDANGNRTTERLIIAK